MRYPKLCKSLEFITCQGHMHATFRKDALFSASLPPFSCPPCLEYLHPRALILLRLWRYMPISHEPTYLIRCESSCEHFICTITIVSI